MFRAKRFLPTIWRCLQFHIESLSDKMSIRRICVTLVLCELLLFPVHILAHQFLNESGLHSKYWIPDHEDDFVGYVVNKKKRSAKEPRFLKFDYLSQNINVSGAVILIMY